MIDEDPTTFDDHSFIMWENTSDMCWLDASIYLIAHNNTMRCVSNERPDALVSKIIKSYDETTKLLNNDNSDQNYEDRLKTVRVILESIQDRILKYLHPLLKFKKGKPESTYHSLLSLIKEDKVIQEYFNVTYAWIRPYKNCDMTRVVFFKKPIITISNVTNFKPEEQFSHIKCQHCNKNHQKMKLIYKTLPPCLIFYFENGAGVGNNIHLKFEVASREYQLTAIMMLEKDQESNVNHFFTYIRDPVNEEWLKCKVLDMDTISFTSDPPLEISSDRLCLKDIYIYVFEAFDDLGIVKIAENPSLTYSNNSNPCKELSDEDDDNSTSHKTSNKEETSGSEDETVEKIQAFLAASLKDDSKSYSSVSGRNKIKTNKEFFNRNDNCKCNEIYVDQHKNLSNKMRNNLSFFIENEEMEKEDNAKKLLTRDCNHSGENTLMVTKKLRTQQNDKLATPVSNRIDYEDYIKKRLFECMSKLAVPLTKSQPKDLSTSKASNELEKQIMVQCKQHMNALNIAMVSHDKNQMTKNDLADISDSPKVISVLKKDTTVSVSSKIEENNSNSIDLVRQDSSNEHIRDGIPNQNSQIFYRNHRSNKSKHKLKKPKNVSFDKKHLAKKSPVFNKGLTKQDKLSREENMVDKKSKHLQKYFVNSTTFDEMKKFKSIDAKNVSKQRNQILKAGVKKEDLKMSRSVVMDFLKTTKLDDNNDDGIDMTMQNLVIPNLQLTQKKNETEISFTIECKLGISIVNCIGKKQLDEETRLETVNDALFEKSYTPTYHENKTDTLGVPYFIMWENTSNLCWLDASMAVLTHNATMRRVSKKRPDAQVSKIIKSYDEAMKMLNNFNSGQNIKDRVKTARGILQSVQESSLKYLQPLLKFKKGEPESAHHSLLGLIKEDEVILEYFNVTYTWIRSCKNCDLTRVVGFKKPIITISNVTNFKPEEHLSPIKCQHCNKKDQKMKLTYKTLPPCLIFHFENGAGVGNIHLKFKVASREYQLTALMLLKKGQECNVNHFVTYIRDPVNEKWLKCNDLDMTITSFTSDPPLKISPDRLCLKDIYIYVFEAFDDLGTVKIAENSSLTYSSHSNPCIELPDVDDDNSHKITSPEKLNN